jgi:hypothetical protein
VNLNRFLFLVGDVASTRFLGALLKTREHTRDQAHLTWNLANPNHVNQMKLICGSMLRPYTSATAHASAARAASPSASPTSLPAQQPQTTNVVGKARKICDCPAAYEAKLK